MTIPKQTITIELITSEEEDPILDLTIHKHDRHSGHYIGVEPELVEALERVIFDFLGRHGMDAAVTVK